MRVPVRKSIAKKISDLTSGHAPSYEKGKTECWHCVFAPDESRFAWSRGHKTVTLVPWNRYKNCPCSVDNTDNEGQEILSEYVTIYCGHYVYSLAFGTGTPESTWVYPQRGYWTRFHFSTDLVLAVGLLNGRIRLYNVYSGKVIFDLMDHRRAVRDLAFAPDGSLRLVSGSDDTTIKVWDMSDDGNLIKTLQRHHASSIFFCCWSPNATFVASVGTQKSVVLWNMKTYSLHRRLDGHYHDVKACEFSPDGAMLATASLDTRIILWDPYTGDILRILCHIFPPPRLIYASGVNSSWVRGVSFSRDGCHVASVADDGYIRFWNLMDDIDPEAIANEADEMNCCCFSPSGKALAVGYKSGCVKFFETPNSVPSLLHLCRMVIRKKVHSTDVKLLDIPSTLIPYLRYNDW